jgi:hypothetical protein
MQTRPAIWFSRHDPTVEQVADVEANGNTLVAIEDGKRLGAISIETDEDLHRVIGDLIALARTHEAYVIYGVFPVPMSEQLLRNDAASYNDDDHDYDYLTCKASWNVMRSVEGGKPTFKHKQWVYVGCLSFPSFPV